MPKDSNSIELTILHHAPQVLARTFAQSRRISSSCRDKLAWRYQFVDALLRYYFSVLVAENIGLGNEMPKESQDLLNRFETPSLGNWSFAIEGLAGNILRSTKPAVVPEFAKSLGTLSESNRFVRGELFNKIIELIDLRNQIAHDDGSPICSELDAKEYLESVVNPAMRVILESLRFFVNHPLFSLVDHYQDEITGDQAIDVLRFSGENPELQKISIETFPPSLIRKKPFLLNDTGTLLFLQPFVRVEDNKSGEIEIWMIEKWISEGRNLSYRNSTASLMQLPAKTLGGNVQSIRDLFKINPKILRVDNAIPPDIAQSLIEVKTNRLRIEIDHLEIDSDRPLGNGASSWVYRARYKPENESPREWLALKILNHASLIDVQRKRLEEEYEVLKSISHRSLPKVHEFGHIPVPYILMEKIAGTSLQAILDRGDYPFEKVVGMAKEILEVLQIVHSQGIVHRDLKPSNIMICDNKSSGVPLKLIDFGIALNQRGGRFTSSMDRLGTLGYAAPEQFENSDVDHRADLFALGRIIEDCLSNKGDSTDRIPPGMLAIIKTATQPKREHRFNSAAEMLDAINERQQGKWKGVPVQGNAPLDENHELLDFRHAEAGIFVFDAIEIATRRQECIALAVEDVAKKRLLRASSGMPAGTWITQVTGAHDILYAILPSEGDHMKRIAELYSEKPTVVQSKSRKEKAVKGSSAKDVCLQQALLRGLREVKTKLQAINEPSPKISQESIILETTTFLESLLLVLVIHGTPRDKIQWSQWQSCPNTFGGLVRWAQANGDWSHELRASLMTTLAAIVELRNKIAHDQVGKNQKLPVDLLDYACAEVSELIRDIVPSRGSGQVSPYLKFNRKHMIWQLLRPVRSETRYEAYDLNWKRNLDLEKELASSVDSMKEKKKHSELLRIENLKVFLSGRPYGRRIERNVKIHGSVSRMEVDFLVYEGTNRPLLVVEMKSLGDSSNLVLMKRRWEEQLWFYARDLSVPFALLEIDGVIHWYRVDQSRGLESLPNDDEIVAAYLKTSR